MLKVNATSLPLIAALWMADEEGNFVERHFDELFAYFLPEMPYGVAKARTGDPYSWIAERLGEIYRGA